MENPENKKELKVGHFVKWIFFFVAFAMLIAPVTVWTILEIINPRITSMEIAGAMIMGLYAGYFSGLLGIMILGFLCHGNESWKLLGTLFLIGISWFFLYPAGWVIGSTLVIYAVGKSIWRDK